HLAAIAQTGEEIIGEVNIDNLAAPPKSIFLYPQVQATPEAVCALRRAEVILLGPGSFLTSIIPPILLTEVGEILRNSDSKKIFIDNLATEHGPAASLSLPDRIRWIENIVGKPVIDGAIVPLKLAGKYRLPNVKIIANRLNADDISYRHDRTLLCKAIDELIGELA
ncbi:MAG TPA: hypothetical protein DD638_06770, partial [Pasteurellaceae bacterium]|nr:hypothetical protein [Pasteurellaceae bacterium]